MSHKPKIFSELERIAPLVSTPMSWGNTDGIILGANDFQIVGATLSKSEIVGKTLYDIYPKDVADELMKNSWQVIKERKAVTFEEAIVDIITGKTKYFLATRAPLLDDDSVDVVGVVCTAIDITERKEAEELRAKNLAAEKVIAFCKLMAGAMAHELRTPISAIGSQIDTLKMDFEQLTTKEELEPVFSNVYKNIKNSIKEGMHTVNDMLLKLRNFSSGKLPVMDCKELAIAEDIEKFLSTFPFQEGDRALIKVISGGEFTYLGDSMLTFYVLGNIIKNAREAINDNGRKGDITIKFASDKEFNQLIIKDTGTGIPKEFVTKIFDQFATKKSLTSGAGLGLAFCKAVMEAYGGTISCKSELKKYTEFVLNFPKIVHK